MSVDKSKRPYYDDYNEEKGFHEILFIPQKAVQVRELNQLQTMFYDQIKRFGNHVFVEGSVVIPGEHNFDLDFSYVTVNISNYEAIKNALTGSNIRLVSNTGINANVKLFAQPEGNDPATFYLEYIDSSLNGEQSIFPDTDQLQIFDGDTELGIAVVVGTGIASKFTINNGVYYLGGRFVLVQEQTVLLDKYDNTPSVIVGLQYEERIITENEDESLFDNAQGTPNFVAPGAHRLQVDTKLYVADLEDIDQLPENVVEIARFKDGDVQKKYSGPEYNILNDVLAQRTFEQAGDYTVSSFGISFDEAQDPDKYTLNVSKGVAYVNGYRIDNLSTLPIVSDRARSRGVINNSSISTNLGYYILVEDLNVLPNLTQLQQITFYSGTVSSPGTTPSGTVLGTANIRLVRKDGANYRLYLFNVKDTVGNKTTGFISNSNSVFSSVGSPALSANLVESELMDPSNNSLVFPLNVGFVKSLLNGNGQSDTSYASVRQVSSSVDTNGNVVLQAQSNEVFVNQDASYAIASFTDTGDFFDITSAFTLGGTPTGSTITINFGVGNAGRAVRINLQVAKQEAIHKVKSPSTLTITGTPTAGVLSLGKADVYKLISVKTQTNVDVTNQFTLVENKTPSYYGVSYIQGSITGQLTVEFEYFNHSIGDYFSVDSYSAIAYDDIPTENGVKLSDVLDFRPRMNDAGTGFTGAGSAVGNIPTPFTIIRADIDHYLARRDKLIVSTSGEFSILKGVPSLEPKLPEDPSDAMVLYHLDIPPYTASHTDISAQRVSNRRYTMKDIGKLDERIGNLEYYVTLNLLEQETEAKAIVDPLTGLNRFKNGFLVDSFVDHSVGDFGWDGYHVSVSDMGELRPEFSLYATDLEINHAESENIVEKNGIVTLPYNEVSFIRQNYRSTTINVNPYAIYRWIGDLTLNPQIDTWIDTVYKDPDVTYRVFNNGRLTQQWNSWQVNWTGGTTTQQSTGTTIATRESLAAAGIAIQGLWMLKGRSLVTSTTTTTTRTNVDVIADRILDRSVIPYMRSIDIQLTGVGSRPRTRMHFFFDGVNINNHVRPNINVAFGTPVVCDSAGNFNAIFRIPNNNQLRFRTGDKILSVTDNPNNQIEFATSYSEATFTSSGVLNTRQRTVIATRQVNTSTTSARYIHRDPIAQSFVVEQSGGVFVTKINTFFSTKDKSVPISIELREMENGTPTQRVIPGGIKMLLPSQVNISPNGSIPTTFEFPYPVHLSEGEYCFVLISNSNNYNAHIATMGQQDKGTGNYIVEQPYSGVMFKSQNNSTWTEDQNSDIQFEIFGAEFNTNVVGKLVLQNKNLVDIDLDLNPIHTTSGSSSVVIDRFMHNYVVGSRIEIKSAVGGNGLTAAELNKVHTISEIVSPNQIRVQLSQTANVTGVIGGATVSISDSIQATVINPNIRYVQLPNTGIEYLANGTTGQSIDGEETPFQQTGYFPFTNGETNELPAPMLVTNSLDQQANMSGRKSVTVEASLASINPNISPVIDLEGSNIIMPFAMVTHKDAVEADGSNNHANYRTRINELRNPANSLRVLFDVLKPIGSDVILSARFGNALDEIESANWQTLNPISVSVPGDDFNYLENEYSLDDVGDYTLYQIMVQLKSKNAAKLPILKRLRAIALGT